MLYFSYLQFPSIFLSNLAEAQMTVELTTEFETRLGQLVFPLGKEINRYCYVA